MRFFKCAFKFTWRCAALLSLLTLVGCHESSSKTPSPVTISFGYWDVDSLQNTSASDGITEFLEHKFNFTANVLSFNWKNYKHQYQILSVTDSLPDVFTNVLLSSSDANDTAVFNQMITDNLIRPLPADLSDYPYLEALLSNYEYLKNEDGLYYAIPHAVFRNQILSSSDAALLVRKDWMQNLNISAPQNLEEFISMTTAFAKCDPDGNGIHDTLGYNVNSLTALGKWVILGIAPDCNVYSWIQDTDGVYRPSWMTDKFKNVVSAYRNLYISGGLDPDFFAKNESAVVDDFVSGRLGALEYKSSPFALSELEDLWNQKNSVPFDECVDVLPIFPAPDGNRYSNSSNTFWAETYISSKVNDEEFSIILSLLNYLLSEEGTDLYNLGIENTDYKYIHDEKPISLLNIENTSYINALRNKYPSLELWSNLSIWGWGYDSFEETPENIFLYGKSCLDLAQKALNDCKKNTIQVTRPYDFLIYPKEQSNFSSEAFNAFIQCIIGENDPLVMWEDALEKLRSQGLDKYVERQNQLYLESISK